MVAFRSCGDLGKSPDEAAGSPGGLRVMFAIPASRDPHEADSWQEAREIQTLVLDVSG